MKTKKVLSVLLAAVLVMLTFSSCSLTKTGPEYKEIDGTVGLYRYKSVSTETEFVIPDTYNGKKVTQIMAFGLANAEYLKTISIGKNIEKIDVWALTNMPVLEKITVAEDNPNFKSVDGVLYNKDMTAVLAYPNGKTPLQKDKKDKIIGGGAFAVPDTVTEIGENAFYLCSNIVEVKFNSGLKKIGNKAFLKCINLRKIDLPDTVTEIGNDAFSYCNSVKKLEIPSSVKSIGDYGFFSTASKIKKVVVHNEEKNLKLGKDWLPNMERNVRKKVAVVFRPAK